MTTGRNKTKNNIHTIKQMIGHLLHLLHPKVLNGYFDFMKYYRLFKEPDAGKKNCIFAKISQSPQNTAG